MPIENRFLQELCYIKRVSRYLKYTWKQHFFKYINSKGYKGYSDSLTCVVSEKSFHFNSLKCHAMFNNVAQNVKVSQTKLTREVDFMASHAVIGSVQKR